MKENKEKINEEWAEVVSKDRYNKYGAHQGCCGGDYCEGDHNSRIADWWLSKLDLAYEQGKADGMDELHEIDNANYEGAKIQALSDLLERLDK